MSMLRSVGLAVSSQLHPKMMALLVVPWLVSLAAWGLVMYFSWAPVTALFTQLVFGVDGSGWLGKLVSSWGIGDAKSWVGGALSFLLFVPLIFATAMVMVAVFAMPAVIRHLSAGPYRDVARQGSFSVAGSLWNVLSALAIFLPGYILTIPLWFVPLLGLLVPLFWWSWLNSRVMRFDSLVEHATMDERQRLSKNFAKQYWLIAIVIGVLNYIPPLFLLTPVLSALAFAHFSLNLLRIDRNLPVKV